MPSTIASARSTSPPKSAWPGVSTMLIFTPFQCTDADLARIVMPRSRSWSLESMTRSTSALWASNVPVWRRIVSTSVVLPWSTCATRAMFRSAGRAVIRGQLILRLWEPIDVFEVGEREPPGRGDANGCDPTDDDRRRCSQQLAGDAGLERAELVRPADEDVLHREHATAQRGRRGEGHEGRPDEHAHRVRTG